MIRQYDFNHLRESKSKCTGVQVPCPVNNPRTCNDGRGPSNLFVGALIAEHEGHRLNNKDNALRRYLAGLSSANRLLVTETPRQNSVAELRALLHFLNLDHFDVLVAFEGSFSFSALGDEGCVVELHSTLQPSIMRDKR